MSHEHVTPPAGPLERLIDLCLAHRPIVLVAASLLVLLGVHALQRLPLDAFPDTTPVQVTVNTVAPTLSPLEIGLTWIGVPILRWDRSGVEALRGTPVVWVQGDEDEFGGGELARATAVRFGWELALVAGADHFFTGRLDAFEAALAERLAGFLGG